MSYREKGPTYKWCLIHNWNMQAPQIKHPSMENKK
jgi:hypothetical protein